MTGNVDLSTPYGRLAVALAEIADQGERLPCQGRDRDLWTSDSKADREAATYRCAGCPVIGLCRDVIEATPKARRWFVWAGRDWTPSPKKENNQ